MYRSASAPPRNDVVRKKLVLVAEAIPADHELAFSLCHRFCRNNVPLCPDLKMYLQDSKEVARWAAGRRQNEESWRKGRRGC